ncbi:cob(I)yrinic acid a,c-diamide adenosyltransferase [Candidatus Woesearchaeota archaeon]|nr:cob(I)yrinic acid a,c-diamide adenosyltransferase [Candidatus Woesearchaeota archaeon]
MVTKIKAPIYVEGEEDKRKLGLVHVITGDGKGKTTSSLGLAMRATGNGLKVHMVQFLKSGATGELYSSKKLGFAIEQFGVDIVRARQKNLQEYIDKTGKFVFQPDELEREAAIQGFEHAKTVIKSGEYDLVILDEINCVLDKGLIPITELIALLKEHGTTEIILTGRDAPEELYEFADYVSQVKMVKHPWQKGIKARKGIEY